MPIRDKRAIAEDKKYLAWLRTQPCCLTGIMPTVAAHVRRSNNSGVGLKPLFSAVPLTDEVHKYQHNHGELACLLRFGDYFIIQELCDKGRLEITVELAKHFFDEQAKKHYFRWRVECVKA